MRRFLLAAAASGLVMAGARLAAHHSFGAVYLEADMIEIEGTVVEFQYKNPHAWLFVSGSEQGGFGAPKTYGAEWVSTSQLEREGIEKDTIKPGDRVRLWGSPSKNPSEAKLHLKKLERADGWTWQGRAQAR